MAAEYGGARLQRHLSALLTVLLALAVPARAAGVEGSLRLSARALADGNAPREFSDGTEPPLSGADLTLAVLASAEGRYAAESWLLSGRYDGGVRKYLRFPTEDALVQALALEGSLALSPEWVLGVQARGKDRRGPRRPYSDLAADLFAEYSPQPRWLLRARGSLHRFVYWPSAEATFGGPEAGATVRYRLDSRHSLALSGEYGARLFSVPRRPRPEQPAPSGRRVDQVLSASASWSWRGPLALAATYAFQHQGSNSYGETVLRHRLTASAGLRLPWQLFLLAQGSLGLFRYPDGVYLSGDLLLLEDDEAQNSLSLRLARPVEGHLDLELTWAVYATQLPGSSGLSYLRQVGGVGLTWRP